MHLNQHRQVADGAQPRDELPGQAVVDVVQKDAGNAGCSGALLAAGRLCAIPRLTAVLLRHCGPALITATCKHNQLCTTGPREACLAGTTHKITKSVTLRHSFAVSSN